MADRDIPEEADLDDEEIDAAVQRMRDDKARRILADPAGHLADRIVEIAQVVRGEGALAARPGQMARLEKAADQLVTLAEEVRTGSMREVLSAALAGRQVVAAVEPSEMPPVPCPDCMHPTEHDGDLFHCTGCGQAFSTPNGMDLSMWWELWQAWTVRRQIVALPEPDGTSYEGDPTWGAHVDYEDIIFACVNNGRPEVDGPIGDEPLPADVAEMYGLRLLAAAREARRLAAGSGSGEG